MAENAAAAPPLPVDAVKEEVHQILRNFYLNPPSPTRLGYSGAQFRIKKYKAKISGFKDTDVELIRRIDDILNGMRATTSLKRRSISGVFSDERTCQLAVDFFHLRIMDNVSLYALKQEIFEGPVQVIEDRD